MGTDGANSESMWQDAHTRKVLLAGAAAQVPVNGEGAAMYKLQSIHVRVKALGVIKSLAEYSLNRETMWAERRLANTLLEAAKATESLRVVALRILVSLTRHDDNCVPMTESGVCELLSEA